MQDIERVDGRITTIAAMNKNALVVPFGLPPPELAKDLLKHLRMPALATLLAKGSMTRADGDPYAQLLPHQAWLLEQVAFGDDSLTRAAMQACGLAVSGGTWFALHPANLHIARDHLVLTDPRQLPLTEAESRQLFDVAHPVFTQAGFELAFGSPGLWFLRADDWRELRTAAPDAAVGHNIDIWMPKGAGEREWRKLHNEIQMLWHMLPLNEEREANGLARVNSLWCWNADAVKPGPADGSSALALASFFPGLPDAASPSASPALQVLHSATGAALGSDWGRWIEAMEDVDQLQFGPALQALRGGKMAQLTVVLTDSQRLLRLDCTRLALNRFWSRPSLSLLAA